MRRYQVAVWVHRSTTGKMGGNWSRDIDVRVPDIQIVFKATELDEILKE